MIDDVIVGGEHAVGEPVVAHKLPDVLDGVELWALGWQRDDADVVGHDELSGHVPTGLIHQHDRVSAGGDGEGDFGKMQGHHLCIAEGQNKAGTLALLGADRAEDVGRFRPLILGR